MKTFSLGYSPNSWDGLYNFLRKKGYDDEIMEKAGLVIRMDRQTASGRGYYDRFRGRVMFTLKDHRGNVVGFAGRVLDPNAKEAKYINTQETPVYLKSNLLYALDVTKDAIQKANEAVVMEGELDVISSFQAGIPNVVAIKGSALTEGHVRLLRRFTERLTFALDSDMAGDAAARRGIEIADHAGLDMKVVTLPSGKDPDDAARENPGLLKKAIKDAEPIYDYFLASVKKRFDLNSTFGKRKASEELMPVIAKIDNPIVQNHYVKKIATLLDTSEVAIDDSLERVERGLPREKQAQQGEATAQNTILSRPDKLEAYLLAMLLQGKTTDLFEDLQEAGLLPEFNNPAILKIIDSLVTYLSPKDGEPEGAKVFLLRDFADSLPAELLPTLDEACLWDIADFLSDEELFMREWLRTLKDFHKVVLRRKIQDLTKGTQNDSLDSSKSANLQRQLTKLTDTLRGLDKSS